MSQQRVDGPWSRATQDAWFYGWLAVSTASLAFIIAPFFSAILAAAVMVVVSWPVYVDIRARCGGREALAAVLTATLLGLLVFVPLVVVLNLFLVEALGAVRVAIDLVSEDRMSEWAATIEGWRTPMFEEYLGSWIGEGATLTETLLEPLRSGFLTGLNTIGSAIPAFFNEIVARSIEALLFAFATLTFYMKGPRVLQVLASLSPMDDRYEERLFQVFRELAFNLVIGSVATAAVQGVVASIGYAIVGLERVVFLGILTAVFSFMPLVGTLFIWLPLSIYVGVTDGWQWGLFLGIYSLAFTGTVDNLLKPVFLRGGTDIHPMLIFLAVFGGMYWFGLAGVIAGPILAAFFVALYTIYEEDFLGVVPEVSPAAVEPGTTESAGPSLGPGAP